MRMFVLLLIIAVFLVLQTSAVHAETLSHTVTSTSCENNNCSYTAEVGTGIYLQADSNVLIAHIFEDGLQDLSIYEQDGTMSGAENYFDVDNARGIETKETGSVHVEYTYTGPDLTDSGELTFTIKSHMVADNGDAQFTVWDGNNNNVDGLDLVQEDDSSLFEWSGCTASSCSFDNTAICGISAGSTRACAMVYDETDATDGVWYSTTTSNGEGSLAPVNMYQGTHYYGEESESANADYDAYIDYFMLYDGLLTGAKVQELLSTKHGTLFQTSGNFTANFTFDSAVTSIDLNFSCDDTDAQSNCSAAINDGDCQYQDQTKSISVPSGTDFNITICLKNTNDTKTPILRNLSIGESAAGGPDTTPPTISSLTNDTTDNQSVVITWSTNEAANESNTLGVCPSFTGTFSNSNATSGTSHTQSIGGLANITNYCYNTTACDSSGNCASGNFSFWTQANPPEPKENITSVCDLYINGTAGNFVKTNNHTINVTGVLSTGVGNTNLTRNTTTINHGQSPLENVSNYTSPSYFLFNFSYPGNANYTACHEAWVVDLTTTSGDPSPNNLSDLLTIPRLETEGEIFRIIINVTANQTDISDVTAYLNIDDSFNFLSDTPQNRSIGTVYAGNGTVFSIYLAAPIKTGSFPINITYYDSSTTYSGETKKIRIGREADQMSIAIAIILMSLSAILIFVSFSLDKEKHVPMQLLLLSSGLVMMVIGLNFGYLTAVDLGSSTAIQNLLQTAYKTSIYILVLFWAYILMYYIYHLFNHFRQYREAERHGQA